MQGNPLMQVEEGMRVFDRLHNEIGTVEWVKISDDDPSTPEVEAATAERRARATSFIENIAEVFAPDQLPEEVRDRLLQQGFIRIDADGLFAADRYVTPDQILSVEGDEVMLSVTRDELLKRH